MTDQQLNKILIFIFTLFLLAAFLCRYQTVTPHTAAAVLNDTTETESGSLSFRSDIYVINRFTGKAYWIGNGYRMPIEE